MEKLSLNRIGWEVVEPWVLNQVNKNLWRVLAIMSFEDLYQEAFLDYIYVCDKYPQVTEPAHFMSLFKLCFTQHVHDLSCKQTKVKREVSEVVVNGEQINSLFDLSPETVFTSTEELDLQLTIEDAPQDIRKVLEYFVTGGTCSSRVNKNEFFKKLAGITDTSRNLFEEVKSWLSEQLACRI